MFSPRVFSVVMEEVLSDWKRFSLLEEENKKIILDSEFPVAKEVILAAKFLTRRVLNIEAIGRTLKPLWKSQNGFEMRDVGNHIILFVFSNVIEADRIIALEPWTYDKNLIILSRYDGLCPIRDVSFHSVNFWVQLHGLPVSRLNEKHAYGIGETLGAVSKAFHEGELFGGNFLRVRVGVNVAQPLNRGRIVRLGTDEEAWVSFKYEKMPNFCYWCGMVSHDAKECSIWLASKASLSLDRQEYGPWLRADPFSVGKKSFLFVPGSGDDFGGTESGRRGRGSVCESEVAGSWPENRSPVPVNTVVDGGAQEPRGSSPKHGSLSQPVDMVDTTVRESDIGRENGKEVKLMGKQTGKPTEVDSPSSISKSAVCDQGDRAVGPLEKVGLERVVGAHSKWSATPEPHPAVVNGPIPAVTSLVHFNVDEGSQEPSHIGPCARTDFPTVSPELQVRKWTRVPRLTQVIPTKPVSDVPLHTRPTLELSESQPVKKRGVSGDEAPPPSASSVVAVSQPRRSP